MSTPGSSSSPAPKHTHTHIHRFISDPVCASCGIRASEYEKILRETIRDLAQRIKTLEEHIDRITEV